MVGGFYGVYYTGVAGSGFGLIAMRSDKITGIDASGGVFNGYYKTNAKGDVEGILHLEVPANQPLVTGSTSPSSLKLIIPFHLPSDLGGGEPVLLQTSTGPINVAIKKLADI